MEIYVVVGNNEWESSEFVLGAFDNIEAARKVDKGNFDYAIIYKCKLNNEGSENIEELL